MYCVSCGTSNDDNNFRCVQCGAVMQPPIGQSVHAPRPSGGDEALAFIVPIGRSGLSIAASYLGLFAFVLWPLAPLALVFGILAVRDLKRHPDKKGMPRAVFAIVAGGLLTLAGVAVILALALR